MPPIYFDLTGTEQGKNQRDLLPGELVEAINVRRLEEGPSPLRKRLGLDKTTVSSFVSSGEPVVHNSHAGSVTGLECEDAALLWRESGSNRLWAHDTNFGVGRFRGIHHRAFPRYISGTNRARKGRTHKPLTVSRNFGAEIWQFSICDVNDAQTAFQSYQLTVIDTFGPMALNKTTVIAAANIVGWTAAVDASDNVWVFWFVEGTDDHKIFAHKFTGIPAQSISTPTQTTFFTGAANLVITGIDAQLVPGTTDIAVVAIGYEPGTPNIITDYRALLDTSTGLPKSSPAAVTTTVNGGNGAPQTACISGLSIQERVSGDTFFSYTFFREKVGVANQVELVRKKVTASTLALSGAEAIVHTITSGLSGSLITIGTTAGYVDTSENLLWCLWQPPSSPDDSESLIITWRAQVGVVGNQLFMRSAYVAGKPFKQGGVWFFLLGFDDGSQKAQRRYMLVATTDVTAPVMAIAGVILDAEAPPLFHAGGLAGAVSSTGFSYSHQSPHVVTPVGGSGLYGLLRVGLTEMSPDPVLVQLDMGATYYSESPRIVPGGVPAFAGALDRVADLSPQLFPFRDLSFNSLGTGSTRSVNRMTYRWMTREANGDVHRSAPRATKSYTFLDSLSVYTCKIPACPHANGEVWLELYGSVNGGTDLYLQLVVLNDLGVATDTIDVVIAPQNFTQGELLDTGGGALEPASLLPSRLAVEHRNRTWLAGTPDDEIWPSLEHRKGRGPEFNETLAFKWARGTGELQAMAPVDDSTLGLAKRDALALVTGNGPDGLGRGSFDIKTLSGKDGCANPFAFIHAKLAGGFEGVVFPRWSDGRMCLLTAAGVVEIWQGMEDWSVEFWVGAVDWKTFRELHFYANSGNKLVLDYGHPAPNQPWGQWYKHSNTNLTDWAGARLVLGWPTSVPASAGASVKVWAPGVGFTDDGTEIKKRWKTGKLEAAGEMGEFDLQRGKISCATLGGSSAYTITVTDDVGNSEAHSDPASSIADLEFGSGRQRTRTVQLLVDETTPSGEGRQFDGVTLEVNPYDRPQFPRRRIG